ASRPARGGAEVRYPIRDPPRRRHPCNREGKRTIFIRSRIARRLWHGRFHCQRQVCFDVSVRFAYGGRHDASSLLGQFLAVNGCQCVGLPARMFSTAFGAVFGARTKIVAAFGAAVFLESASLPKSVEAQDNRATQRQEQGKKYRPSVRNHKACTVANRPPN